MAEDYFVTGAQPVSQIEARIGGFAYLVTIVCGLFAEAYARSGIRVSSDPMATLVHLRASEPLFRLGIGADLVMLGCYIVVTAILYRLFRQHDALLSAIAAGFSLIGIAVLAFAVIFLLAALVLASPGNGVAGPWPGQLPADVELALRLHANSYGLSLVFFGVYCCLIGAMILRTGLLPTLVGWLIVLAGIAFLLKSVAGIVVPELGRQIPPVAMLTSLIGEGAVALWLAIFGVRTQSAAVASRRA